MWDTGDVGKGFPDLVVLFMDRVHLLEIKDGSLPPSKRKLTPDEKKFHQQWESSCVHVVNNYDEALIAIGIDPTGYAPF